MKDRILFHYEAPMDAGGPALVDPGVDPVDDGFGDDPVVEAWSGPSQEEWGQMSQGLQYLLAQQQAQQAGPAQAGPGYDPLDLLSDPEAFDRLIQERISQATQPLSEWHEAQQAQEGQQRLQDVIADDVARNGEFLFGERASSIVINAARDYYPEAARRYGEGDRAAEAAIARAAKELREAESALRDRIIEQHMNQLTNLAGAGREPGAFTQAAQQVTTTPGGDELSLVRKYGGLPQ